jgi:hypothetical protein
MSFPSSIQSRDSLLTPINNFSTIILSDISDVQTSIPVGTTRIGATNLVAPGVVSIGTETIYFGAINPVGPTLINCVRGYDGTQAVPHSSGSIAELRWVAAHHNGLADLLYAIETALGTPLLDASNQLGIGNSYANLATALSATLPLIVPINPATTVWTATHTRGRVVGVQLYAVNPSTGVYTKFDSPITQVIGPTSTVSATGVSTATAGVMVLL